MARARNIKPGFFLNEALVELPFSTRLLFIGLWTVADREGRLEDRPKKIKMAVFPADDVDVNAGLNELQTAGMLTRYIVDNKGYIAINNFLKHQSPHVKEVDSCIPAPDKHGASMGLKPLIPSSLIPDSLDTYTPPPADRDLALAEWFDTIAPLMGAKNRFGLTRQAAWKSVCGICMAEGYKPPDLVAAIKRIVGKPNFDMKYFTPEKALDELRVKQVSKAVGERLPTTAEKLADAAAHNAAMIRPPQKIGAIQ